ncbi:MAG TPA: hypothetical protein VMZ52_10250 [Bryobacteraceae bacterium]|nr:hypothetical protein [Bryobacteraceae bacterium]
MKSLLLATALCAALAGASVTIRSDGVQLFDGKPAFPIGFTTTPAVGAKAPAGGDAYRELARNGVVFNRCGRGGKWDAEAEAYLDALLDHAAKNGVLCAIYIPELTVMAPGDAARERELRRAVNKYKIHPATAFWKGSDEPEWGKIPVENLRTFYQVVHELDPYHPVWITQAPRGTVESLKRYDPFYDIGAIDIYPVSYPPGVHTEKTNKGLSMTGDYAHMIAEVTGGRKPFWMVLQICFSGVIKPGRTLRFPTIFEQRYMSYQSIIAGARGLLYFGGNVPACWNDSDRALGWNWSFYRRVLQPVLDELRAEGPLYPALIAPDSKLPVRVSGAEGVEFRVRESGNQIFLLAAKREGATVQVTFSGLPDDVSTGALLYEEPRQVTAKSGRFTDWFGPNEVHVYRFVRLR